MQNVKISSETKEKLRQILGVDKATLDLENDTILLNTAWDVQKFSEKFSIDSVNGQAFKPVVPQEELNEKMREELDQIHSGKPYVGLIIKTNFPGFSGLKVLVAITPDNGYVISHLRATCSNTIALQEGLPLNVSDVFFTEPHEYEKIAVSYSFSKFSEWLPGNAEVVGKVTNLEALKPITSAALSQFSTFF